MNKFLGILAAFLLLCWPAQAGWYYAGGGAAAFCSCTGDVIHCWEITGSSTTITSSGGCSVGDTTATASGTPSIVAAPAGKTGYAILSDGAGEFYNFDAVSRDIWSEVAWTIQMDVYLIAIGDDSIIARFMRTAGTDDFRIETDNTDEVRANYYGNSVNVTAVTSGANIAINTWYTITVKGRTADLDPNLYVEVNSVSASSNTNLTAFSLQPIYIRFGNQTGATYGYIKNIKIWNSWQ